MSMSAIGSFASGMGGSIMKNKERNLRIEDGKRADRYIDKMGQLGAYPESGGGDTAPRYGGGVGDGESSGGYINSLIGSESGGNFRAENDAVGHGGQRGHFGRVQFGQARLEDAANAGAIPRGTTPQQFMADPNMQMAAEKWHFGDLERQLSPLVGSVVNGQKLDLGSLVAMGHLGGAGGARKYVETGGKYNPADVNGTSLSKYASMHAGKVGERSGQVGEGGGGGNSDPMASKRNAVRTQYSRFANVPDALIDAAIAAFEARGEKVQPRPMGAN